MYIFRTGFVNAKLLFLQHNHICNLQLLEIIENGLHLFFDTMSNIGSNCMIDIMVSSLLYKAAVYGVKYALHGHPSWYRLYSSQAEFSLGQLDSVQLHKIGA